ncbi:MAG: DNA-binding protein [Candidatus Korarchaeum sp.]
MISHFHIPSWSHDPSRELRGLLERIPEDLRSSAERLADISETPAPEHGRASYGAPGERLTPRQLYDMRKARSSLEAAREAFEISRRILRSLGYPL